MKIRTTLLSLAFIAGVTVISHAQEISMDWGTGPKTIVGDADVNTDGTLVNAFAFGTNTVADVTVNGVTFQGIVVPSGSNITFGNYDLSSTTGNLTAYDTLSSSTGRSGALTPEYRTLLTGGGSGLNPTTLTLTLGGLSVGQEYVFQFWTSNSALTTATSSSNRFITAGAATASINLLDNRTSTVGDLGQFVVGTFTAADVSQTITFGGATASNDPLINAFQLRALPVPEPSSSILLGLGILGGSFIYRRHRSA